MCCQGLEIVIEAKYTCIQGGCIIASQGLGGEREGKVVGDRIQLRLGARENEVWLRTFRVTYLVFSFEKQGHGPNLYLRSSLYTLIGVLYFTQSLYLARICVDDIYVKTEKYVPTVAWNLNLEKSNYSLNFSDCCWNMTAFKFTGKTFCYLAGSQKAQAP